MTSERISAERLTVGYDKPLIEDICFQVRSGEIMTLIGPNGSGKSTILKTLAGYLKKHGGTVLIEQQDAAAISTKERAKKLSVLLTERIHSDYLTCREVVESGRYPYTGYLGLLSDKDKQAVAEAIRMVSAEDIAEADFSAISDGQRQRILLAKAICQEPDILLLDEPTSYLDIHHKIQFLEILKQLAKTKGVAVIVSMHELDFAEKISDYTLCVKQGTIFQQGKPEDIFTAEKLCALFDVPMALYQIYLSKS